jgi:transcriptional regulator with XRE-family HTH domain
MTVKDDFRKRLRAAMKAAGMKPSGPELERAFNLEWHGQPVSVQTASNWISGKHMPRPDKLLALARALKTDPHALIYGTAASMTVAETQGNWDARATEVDRQAIAAFLGLSAQHRLAVRDVINAFALAYGAAKPHEKK